MTEDENSWVFDSLVCFLNGPIWDAPIQTFIEEKSLIFEPNNDDNEEDYRKIFEEYKNLVDFMLGNFMEDIGITSAQFEYACNRSHERQHTVRFEQNIFEQIWAANNYEMFKRMMTQRNVELQLQALELIERKYGIMPQSFIPNKKQAHATVENLSHNVQNEVKITENLEKTILTEVAKKFPDEESTDVPEIESLMEEKQILEDTREKINSQIVTPEDDFKIEEIKDQNEQKNQKQKNEEVSKSSTEAKSNEDVSKKDVASSPPVITKTDKEEIKQAKTQQESMQHRVFFKQEYLRMQRDKLVALKKEERRKQFDRTDEFVMKKSRPKSAKAAEAMLTGEKSTIPPQELQVRRALAERLKVEVVDKNK
ncbi:hypothetical protein HHI36_003354 [Cryptolaemus montrouzieri]|uniref:Cilia- and flagella-associated protein 36 n=1 Tax=Cryptolaemus montrouzieri TaxID=559131 RepID=A0ABD2PDN6_9CUCU